MCALLSNLAAAAAGLALHFLWRWQNSGDRANRSAQIRTAWVAVPPVVAVYLGVVMLSNASKWIQLAVLMPVVAGAFTALLVVRDPTIQPSDSDRRFVLATVVIVMVIFTALGMAVAAAIYMLPNVPTVLPDNNLIRSSELDLERLGDTRQEALDLVNLGYLWHAICLFIYIFFAVGGNCIVPIYRMGSGSSARGATEAVSAPASATATEYANPAAR